MVDGDAGDNGVGDVDARDGLVISTLLDDDNELVDADDDDMVTLGFAAICAGTCAKMISASDVITKPRKPALSESAGTACVSSSISGDALAVSLVVSLTCDVPFTSPFNGNANRSVIRVLCSPVPMTSTNE